MKVFDKFLIVAGLFANVAVLPLSAKEVAVFTDSPQLFSNATWGTSRAERYDVAVHLGLSQMEGTSIESISFPWQGMEGVSDVKIWLSRNLTVENKVSTPDIVEVAAEYADGKMSATFAQPYSIDAEGMYAGISFTIESRDTEAQKSPLSVLQGEDMFNTGFWVHTSSSYSSRWRNLNEDLGMIPVFEVNLSGVSQNSVALAVEDEHYTVVGEESTVGVTLTSYGSARPYQLTVSETDSDVTENLSLNINEDLNFYFAYPVESRITLPAESALGRHDIAFSVEKVNGEENSLKDQTDTMSLYVCSSRPVHRPLFEEYTGTGCGYCPRGALGMAKLEEMYGEKFVGVAYHISDIMSIADVTDYPNYAPAQPDAYIDRYVKTDPYFGTDASKREFLVDDVWESQEEIFAPVHLSLECEWKDEEKNQLEVTANAMFVRDYEDVDFRISYILAGNGLKGEGAAWLQGNYYSGAAEGVWPADFDIFVDAPRLMPDMTYDHVGLCMPDKDGISGSLPSSIESDVALSHSYTFDIADAINLKGESLIQNKEKLYVVGLILDASTGRVLNSAKVHPGNTSVEEISTSDVLSVEYFNTQGIRLNAPKAGEICIEVKHYQDGRSKSTRKIW